MPNSIATSNKLAEHLPLEQGLRQLDGFVCVHFLLLAEHLPLEQGLRLQLVSEVVEVTLDLAEHLPLEQGC